jgi:hypothetical protein
MTLYYLHRRSRSDFIRDLEGAEFADIAEAREEAVAAARQLMGQTLLKGVIDLSDLFEIETAEGPEAVVKFSEVVDILR